MYAHKVSEPKIGITDFLCVKAPQDCRVPRDHYAFRLKLI